MDRELVELVDSTNLTQSGGWSLVASLKARSVTQCSSLFTSTMWMLESIISLINLQTTQRLVTALIDEKRQSLQEDLHKISAWSDRWEMPFNVDKCQVFQVWKRNKKFDYEMRGVKPQSVQCAKDLGIKIASNIKFSQQGVDAAYKANRMLSFIKKCFY